MSSERPESAAHSPAISGFCRHRRWGRGSEDDRVRIDWRDAAAWQSL